MSLFGFNQTRPIRVPSTHQGDIRVKKRHSNRSKQGSGRDGRDDAYAKTSVHDTVDTVSEVPENVARMKEAEKWIPCTPKELVEGSEDVSRRIAVLEELKELKELVAGQTKGVATLGEAVCRLEQDVGALMQDVGALMTTLRQVVEKMTTREVESPCAPSATVGVVEKDVGNWGSVLAAGSVQAASKSKSKIELKDELKPRKKEKVVDEKPVKAVATKVETEKVEIPEKVVETEVEAPLSFWQWAKPLILTPRLWACNTCGP